MRVNPYDRRGAEREHGAVVVFVAILTTVLIGVSAFALDLGNAWQAKRQLRTATDAHALAAAQRFAEGAAGCDTDYASRNDAEATVTDCHNHSMPGLPLTNFGYVTVSAERPVDYAFAGILGVNSTTAHSTTHAMYGLPSAATGLRPTALCIDANPELTSWLNLPLGPTGNSGTIRIMYNKDHPDACGGASATGNWGILDFNGGANSQSEVREWMANGYPEPVPLSDSQGKTGAFGNAEGVDAVLNEVFPIPIFDSVSGGGGANALFHLVAFAWVRLVGYRTNGSERSRYLDFQFLDREVIQGTCCAVAGLDTGVRAVRMCSVDGIEHPDDCLLTTGSPAP